MRDYFSTYRVEFSDDSPVEFHPTHGQWIQLLHASGFVVENLIEVRPPEGAAPRFDFVLVPVGAALAQRRDLGGAEGAAGDRCSRPLRPWPDRRR